MPTIFAGYCFGGYILISLIVFVSAGYVYRVNAKRTVDDPQKKDYHLLAVALTPIWPILLALWIILFCLRAAAYGMFLVLFTLALLFIRKPFLLIWLIKAANWIGHKAMKANMLIVRLIWPRPTSPTT